MTVTAIAPAGDDLDAFRLQVRCLLAGNHPPASVIWSDRPGTTLFAEVAGPAEAIPHVPRAFASLAGVVACHRNPARWMLLYEALWRLGHGERALLAKEADPLVHRLRRMQSAVLRDDHRMTAFVRFRRVSVAAEDHYVAWYEPEHFTLRRASAFFVDRFARLRFSILTPDLAVHWDSGALHFGPGVCRSEAPAPDGMETWWTRYYAATFNPARNNPDLLVRHMPRRFWRNLPEAGSISELVASAAKRTAAMVEDGTRT
jgi:probable DNA metabolism protein